MVISRSDAKKRRKEGDTLEDSLQGSPKRTKVHAQRKFAQGSSNVSSPALTPVKDKDKVKTNGAVLSPELISSKRPKTEDFLTFLCFRGTPILPPQLDFFNVATIQDNQDEEQCSTGGDYGPNRPSSLSNAAQKLQKTIGVEQTTIPGVAKKNEKCENEAKKKPTTSVQALRKKYQEQRLAKQKASTLSKLAQKVKGKNMVRTRSSALREESRPSDLRSFQPKRHLMKKSVVRDHNISKTLKPIKCMSLRRLSVRGQPKLLRDLESPAIRRGGLRSGGQLPPGSGEGLKPEKPLNHKLPPKERYDKTKTKMFVSSLSDFSSDDDQPLVKKTRSVEQIKPSSKQQLARKMVKRIVKSSRKMHPHMITRSRQQLRNETSHFYPHQFHHHIQKQSQQQQLQQPLLQQQYHQQQSQNASQQLQQSRNLQQLRSQQPQQIVSRYSNRPSRKTKEAAALYMELLGKKLSSHDGEADEDSFSVDSFPELPSTKRNERELEIKAKCNKDTLYQQSQESSEIQQHVQKKENSASKRDISVKKEVEVEKEYLQKKDNLHRKKGVKNEPTSKSKVDGFKDSEENKGKYQKPKEIAKFKSQVVKRSLRIAKDEATEPKGVRIRKKNVKLNMIQEKSKIKVEVNSRPKTKEQFDFYSSGKKLKSSELGHSLRSRKAHILQVGESDTEELPGSSKISCPRRSLRRGSRDVILLPEGSLSVNTSESDIIKIQKSCVVVGQLLKNPIVKTAKISLDSIEDKFSDSDEEPLRKIALKSNSNKKFDIEEGKLGDTTNCKKSIKKESKNISQICHNIKEKGKVITKVTRASACSTDDTTIKVKGGGDSVNVKKVLKNKSVSYSKVTISSDRKNKQLMKEEQRCVVKVRDVKKKLNPDTSVRENTTESIIKNSEKGGKKLVAEIKNIKSSSSTSKQQSSEMVCLKEKSVQRKKKEKKVAKISNIGGVSQASLEGKKRMVCAANSKSDIAGSIPNKFVFSSKSTENTHAPYENAAQAWELIESGCTEKDESQRIKDNVQRNERIKLDNLIRSPISRKSKADGQEKKSSSGAHVHPMRKCLVGIESQFRKISYTNRLQKKSSSLSKKELKTEAQRQSSTGCPKETELELQRRLSMVCLKETEVDSEAEKNQEKIKRKNNETEMDKKSKEAVSDITKSDTVCINIDMNFNKNNVDAHVADVQSTPTSSVDPILNCPKDDPPTQADAKKMQLGDAKFISTAKKDTFKSAPRNLSSSLHKGAEKNVPALFVNKNEKNYCESSFVNNGKCVNADVVKESESASRGLFRQTDNPLHNENLPKESVCNEQNIAHDVMRISTERNFVHNRRMLLPNTDIQGKLYTNENRAVANTVPQSGDNVDNCHTHPTNPSENTILGGTHALSISNKDPSEQCTSLNIPITVSLDPNDSKIKQDVHMLGRNISESQNQEQSEALVNCELYHTKPDPSFDLGNVDNSIPLKLDAVCDELGKGNLVTSSCLPPDLNLRDMKVKEKLNMSAERVKKWLSENCTGNLEHKRDCTLYDRNVCNCGLSIIDDDLCLSDYGNDKMDCISADSERDEGAVKMAATVCPFTNEYTDIQAARSESLSGLKPSLIKETSDNVIASKNQVCNEKSMPFTLKEKSPICLEKGGKSSYLHLSSIQKQVSVPLEAHEKKEEWNKSKSSKTTVCPPQEKSTEYSGNNLFISPLNNSNNVVSSPSNNTEKSKVIESNQILNTLPNQVPIVLENTNSKTESVQEKDKLSFNICDKSVKKGKETKSEVSSTVRNVTKSIHGSERVSEKKSIFQQRRSFPHKIKERKDFIPSANAFSPENESSVYAFETEPDSPPISTPFRRRARDSRTSSTTTSKSEEDLVKLTEEDVYLNSTNAVSSSLLVVSPEKVSSSTTLKSTTFSETQTPVASQSSSQVACTRNSTSIAVQVNLDTEASSETSSQNVPPLETIIPEPVLQRSMECSTQTEVADDDDETEGHLFYIPLQQAPTPTQQLIQGVAVKLGTEGPTGPNQRVIMRAKLVTKPPAFSRPAASAQDGALGIRRSVLGSHPRPTGILTVEQKTAFIGSSPSVSGTYPPVVPVQPTTRSLPNSTVSENKNSRSENHGGKYSSLKVTNSELYKESSVQKGTVTEVCVSSVIESTPTEPNIVNKEKKIQNITFTSSMVATSSKIPGKASAREQRNSNDHLMMSSIKGNCGNTKRNLLKGKMLKVSDPSYTCFPTNVAKFPRVGSPAQLVEAPVFYPSEKEFQDPLEYIDRIRSVAETFGLCRVVPPQNFRPECKVSDDMRFTAYNQYVHKMLYRWGPNVKEMMAIKKYLVTQSVPFTHPPLIGGMEVDLPRLFQTVQSFGGLKEVIEKKRWQRVADGMKIPKSAQDRVTKLDDIYCKYLLPYDTLSPDERQKLLDEVEEEWKQRQNRPLSQDSTTSSDSPEDESDADITDEECIVKGRNMPLNAFYRIARNTMAMWFRQPEPSASEVEQEFWKHVMSRNSHVCVHSGSIDSSGCGYGFPCSKNSPFARHPWNLKVLTNNSGSVLRSIGPIMGVTVPTLHVGMLFTTCCWYRDPHGLPWIEYLHTGANKIWYGIPDSYSFVFQSAMNKLIPRYCKNKTIWLPSDTAMVPPTLLVKHGVSLCHTVQEPGQFIIVFPRAFTSSICTGYLVSESVYFAQPLWLTRAEEVFKDIQDSCEPSMFSLERLLFSIASDARSHIDVLRQILPMILSIKQKELDNRKVLSSIGLKTSERLPLPDANVKRRKIRAAQEEEGDYECEICRANLFVSLVTNSHEEGVYCLPHAIELLTKKRHHLKYCKLMYTYDQVELNELIQKLQDKIEAKSQKKSSQGKQNTSMQK